MAAGSRRGMTGIFDAAGQRLNHPKGGIIAAPHP
jgi:hypothetical protein